jgi:hypothetical protein
MTLYKIVVKKQNDFLTVTYFQNKSGNVKTIAASKRLRIFMPLSLRDRQELI